MARRSLSRCCVVSCLEGSGPGGFSAVLLGEVLLGVCSGFGYFGDSVVHGAWLFVGVPARSRIGGLGWPVGLLRPGP